MSGSTTVFSRGENPLRADKLNTAFSERVLRSGDAMNGPLLLWRDPTQAFEAATKQYVDTRVASVGGGGIAVVSIPVNNIGANQLLATIPANAVIITLSLQERAGHAVTISMGTTAGATDVMPGVALLANQLLVVTQLSFTTLAFVNLQTLYINSAAWGGAQVNAKVWYGI